MCFCVQYCLCVCVCVSKTGKSWAVSALKHTDNKFKHRLRSCGGPMLAFSCEN